MIRDDAIESAGPSLAHRFFGSEPHGRPGSMSAQNTYSNNGHRF